MFFYFFNIDFSSKKRITQEILIPELILLISLFRNIIEWKEKPKENKFHIIDKIYDCCDKYTQYQFSKIKRNLFDFSNLWKFQFYIILSILFLISIIIILLIIFGIKVFIKKNPNHMALIPNENGSTELDEFQINNQK